MTDRPLRHLAHDCRSLHGGVTLYETLVALAVIATVALIGIPALQSVLASTRLVTATNTLVTALYVTRSEAIKRGRRVVLCPSRDQRSCTRAGDWHVGYVLFVDDNGNRRLDGGEALLQVFDAPTGVTVRSSAGRLQVTYLPNGLASGSNLSFAVCARGAGAGRAVVVSNTGRARVAQRMPDGRLPCPDG